MQEVKTSTELYSKKHLKKTSWHTLSDSSDKVLEKLLKDKVKELGDICNKNDIDYLNICVLSSDSSTSINIRAEQAETIKVRGYYLIEEE